MSSPSRVSGSFRAIARRVALVVDDESSVRLVIRSFLERRGWSVLDASTAEQALALVEDDAVCIDAAVVDLNLPGLSGSALCRRISALRPGLARRLVVASGDARQAEVELERDALVVPVFAKPFELSQLGELLEHLVAA